MCIYYRRIKIYLFYFSTIKCPFLFLGKGPLLMHWNDKSRLKKTKNKNKHTQQQWQSEFSCKFIDKNDPINSFTHCDQWFLKYCQTSPQCFTFGVTHQPVPCAMTKKKNGRNGIASGQFEGDRSVLSKRGTYLSLQSAILKYVCLLPLSERGVSRVLGRRHLEVHPQSCVGSWWSHQLTRWGRLPLTPLSMHWCARWKVPRRRRWSCLQCLRCWCRRRTTCHPVVTS